MRGETPNAGRTNWRIYLTITHKTKNPLWIVGVFPLKVAKPILAVKSDKERS